MVEFLGTRCIVPKIAKTLEIWLTAFLKKKTFFFLTCRSARIFNINFKMQLNDRSCETYMIQFIVAHEGEKAVLYARRC